MKNIAVAVGVAFRLGISFNALAKMVVTEQALALTVKETADLCSATDSNACVA